jgi:hypothetical protein
MGRPVRLRTSASGYSADATSLTNLGLALRLDRRLPSKTVSRLVKKVEDLVQELIAVNGDLEKKAEVERKL